MFGLFAVSLKQPGQQPHVPLCAIVSSNPAGVNHIPKSEVAAFGNPELLGVTKPHEISVFDLQHDEVRKTFTSCPIYVTCDAVMAYKLTIPADGT